jgi:glutathione S-transferase
MKLYTSASSPNSWKVLALARELALPVETIRVDLFNGEAKSPAFLAKNPNGRVPVLEEDGFVLWESNAILAYLASRQSVPSLLPVVPRERAEVDRWLFWESTMFSPAVWKVGFEKIVRPIMGQTPDAATIATGTAEFASVARVLDEALAGKGHIAGKLSIADFAIEPFVRLATGPCELEIGSYRNLSAWRDRMGSRASVSETKAEAQAAMSAC